MSTNQTTPDTLAPEAIEVGAEALPVYCPGPHAPAWSMHPRVFLDVTRTGSASCPYCGALYRLKPGAAVPHHH
ncbi:zinc-finger domain-containing protein [Kerstersia similis]|uniref:zinc-finger domain-containing protein n=1 Tax=Kerstersia similis TaxID=206505 RepID=UPI0039EF68B1